MRHTGTRRRRQARTEPARRLRALLDTIAVEPGSRTGEQPWFTQRFTAGPGPGRDVSVTLETDHREPMITASRSVPYRRGPAGRSSRRIVVRTGIGIEHIGAAFAGGHAVDAGADLTAGVLPTDDGFACWIDAHATLLHVRPDTATVRVYCTAPGPGGHWATRLVRATVTAQLELDATTAWTPAAVLWNPGEHNGQGPR